MTSMHIAYYECECFHTANPVTGGDGDGDGDGGSGLTSVASLVIVIMCGVASLVF